ncbi:MAG: hypothetical protein ABIP42_11945 [Planctomycetota bacterium]
MPQCPNCGTLAPVVVVCENCGDRRCNVAGKKADGAKGCASKGGDGLGAGAPYARCNVCKKGIYRKL